MADATNIAASLGPSSQTIVSNLNKSNSLKTLVGNNSLGLNQSNSLYNPITKSFNSLQNNIETKRNNLKSLKNSSSNKFNNILSSTSIPAIAITALGMIISSLFGKNSNIGNMVDNTNSLIEKANSTQNVQDQQIATTSINNTIKAIMDCENDITQIQSRIQTYQIIITTSSVLANVLKITLDAAFTSPSPSKPAAETLSIEVNTLLSTIFSLSNVITIIIPSLLNNIITDLNNQKNRIESLIFNNQSNSSNSSNNSNNSSLSNTNISGSGNNLNNSLNLIDLTGSSNQLGVQNTTYKGFSFVLKQSTDPQYDVGGHIAVYAVAVNSNGVELLKTDPSFTLNPEVLIQQLEAQIDFLGLIDE
jgi:hypothetical protein